MSEAVTYCKGYLLLEDPASDFAFLTRSLIELLSMRSSESTVMVPEERMLLLWLLS